MKNPKRPAQAEAVGCMLTRYGKPKRRSRVMTPCEPGQKRAPGGSKYPTLVIAAGLAVLAFAALIASFISQAHVLGMIVGASRNNDQLQRGADSLAQNFSGIVVRLRYCSAGLLLAALLATIQRAKVQTWIQEAVLPLPQFLRCVAGSLVRSLRADGKLDVWVLLTLSLLGGALRYRFLFQPILSDEADTFLSYASRPLYVGLSWYSAPNNQLFHTLLVHFAWRLFGEQEWAIRLPAFLAGILLIPMTYWAARVLYDKHSALIAASLVTATPTLIGYSAYARGYTMICVLFLLLLITGQYLLGHANKPAWVLWALFAALGLYTIPVMSYAVGTAALWLVLSSSRIERGRPRSQFLASLASAVALAAAVTTLLYLPVVVASGWKPLFFNPWVQTKGFAYLFANFQESVSRTWHEWTTDIPAPLVSVLTVGFVTALALYRRTPWYRVGVPVAAALCIPALLLVQRVVPGPRVWLFLLPLCAAVSGAGLWLLMRGLGGRDEIARSRLSAGIALVCFVGMCIPDLRGTTLASRRSSRGVEDAAVWMKSRLIPGDIVVVQGMGWSPLTYYFRRYGIPLISRPAPCDALSIMYTPHSRLTGKPAEDKMRVLAVSIPTQSPDAVLAGACLAWQPSTIPRLVFESAGIRIHEGLSVQADSQPASKSAQSRFR